VLTPAELSWWQDVCLQGRTRLRARRVLVRVYKTFKTWWHYPLF